MKPISGGLVDFRGGCFTCSKFWSTKNVMGLAAQHAEKNPGHETWAEMGYSFIWNAQ
jgi:hypothetical protein